MKTEPSTDASTTSSKRHDPAVLIEMHQAGVWRYLRALGCERSLADDMTQETFLHVLQTQFEEYSHAATAAYLRRTAHNLYVSYLRRAKRVTHLENLDSIDSDWTSWAGDDNGEALLDSLRECLEKLSARARLALNLRFRERLPRSEIAAELQLTEHGAKNLMQRAKQQLRICVGGKLA